MDAKTAGIPPLLRPNYSGCGIVNLMSSIAASRGDESSQYPQLGLLDDLSLSRFRNVLLIVIDGLGADYLDNTFPDSTIAGHSHGPISSVFPTTTAAAITTFLTGLAPAQHGLTGWWVWLEEIQTLTAVLPFQSRIGGESLRARGHTPAELYGIDPIYPRLKTDCHVISPSRIAYSDFNSTFSRGAEIHSYNTLDEFFARIVSVVNADSAEKYIYAYWPDLDHLGHEYGIGSSRAGDHFNQIDAGYTLLLQQLKNSDTLVLLTADHGVVDTQKQTQLRMHQHPDMAAMLDIPLSGEPRAAYCYIHAGEEPAFEAYVDTKLKREMIAVPSAQLIDQGFFGPAPHHPTLARRVGEYTLLMNDNYAVFDAVSGEKRRSIIGVHGGLSHDELFVPMVIAQT